MDYFRILHGTLKNISKRVNNNGNNEQNRNTRKDVLNMASEVKP